MLNDLFTEDEVKRALFQMHPSKGQVLTGLLRVFISDTGICWVLICVMLLWVF
jgi:hypothetical protein